MKGPAHYKRGEALLAVAEDRKSEHFLEEEVISLAKAHFLAAAVSAQLTALDPDWTRAMNDVVEQDIFDDPPPVNFTGGNLDVLRTDLLDDNAW